MGFDLMGVNPVSEKGDYFRSNVWWWRAIWGYVSEIGSDILTVEELDGGQYNDGTKIDIVKAKTIGNIIKDEYESGALKEYEDKYMAFLDKLPLEECELCEGSGTRIWNKNGKRKKLNCNVCNTEGTKERGLPIGKVKNWSCNYPFSAEVTKEFGQFCEESGGFEIW